MGLVTQLTSTLSSYLIVNEVEQEVPSVLYKQCSGQVTVDLEALQTSQTPGG